VDWKAHKLICKTLKKLSHQLQPYREVVRLIKEIICEEFKKGYLNGEFKKAELNGRVLKHLLSYAEYQFGNRVPLKVRRERDNGETIDNWTVEIDNLILIHSSLTTSYIEDKSLSMVSGCNLRFPLYEKMLDLLRPWSDNLDSNSTGRIDSMTKDQMNEILMLSAEVENDLATIHMNRSQFNLVETHCQRGLSYARLYEGTEDKKADLLCGVLQTFIMLRSNEGNYADALSFAEEAYNCAAVAYNPVHPRVQKAASTLIECLTRKGDLCNVELFAQMTLDSLKDPKNGLDQQSEAVARGYYDLANVIADQREDLVKAEMLARESLRIRVLINSTSPRAGNAASLLATVLRMQDKWGSEPKELLEQSLAINIRNYGPDGVNTASAHFNLGIYYRQLAAKQQTSGEKKECLRLSKIEIKEALRMYTKFYGPDDSRTLSISSQLSTTIRLLSEV
jgi:tetratricopeptide (TPR) repeat protein